MSQLTESVMTILLAIIGVAILALLISPRARTSEVVQSLASGFVNSLATAQSPVTGNKVDIVSAYPNQGGFGGFSDYSSNY